MTTALQTLQITETHDDGREGGGRDGTGPGDGRSHRVCRLEDLEPMWGEAALIGGEQVAMIRVPGDRVFAVAQWDPFAQANVMARGIVGTKAGRPTLASPIHKQVYDLLSGECLSEDGLRLRVFDVDVDAAGLVHVTV